MTDCLNATEKDQTISFNKELMERGMLESHEHLTDELIVADPMEQITLDGLDFDVFTPMKQDTFKQMSGYDPVVEMLGSTLALDDDDTYPVTRGASPGIAVGSGLPFAARRLKDATGVYKQSGVGGGPLFGAGLYGDDFPDFTAEDFGPGFAASLFAGVPALDSTHPYDSVAQDTMAAFEPVDVTGELCVTPPLDDSGIAPFPFIPLVQDRDDFSRKMGTAPMPETRAKLELDATADEFIPIDSIASADALQLYDEFLTVSSTAPMPTDEEMGLVFDVAKYGISHSEKYDGGDVKKGPMEAELKLPPLPKTPMSKFSRTVPGYSCELRESQQKYAEELRQKELAQTRVSAQNREIKDVMRKYKDWFARESVKLDTAMEHGAHRAVEIFKQLNEEVQKMCAEEHTIAGECEERRHEIEELLAAEESALRECEKHNTILLQKINYKKTALEGLRDAAERDVLDAEDHYYNDDTIAATYPSLTGAQTTTAVATMALSTRQPPMDGMTPFGAALGSDVRVKWSRATASSIAKSSSMKRLLVDYPPEDNVIKNLMQAQLEYYLSNQYLKQDKRLLQEVQKPPLGYLRLTEVLRLTRVRQLSTNRALVAAAIRQSAALDLRAFDRHIDEKKPKALFKMGSSSEPSRKPLPELNCGRKPPLPPPGSAPTTRAAMASAIDAVAASREDTEAALLAFIVEGNAMGGVPAIGSVDMSALAKVSTLAVFVGRRGFKAPAEKPFPFRHTVFVYGIPKESSQEFVEEMLSPFGTVNDMKFDVTPDDARIAESFYEKPRAFQLFTDDEFREVMYFVTTVEDMNRRMRGSSAPLRRKAPDARNETTTATCMKCGKIKQLKEGLYVCANLRLIWCGHCAAETADRMQIVPWRESPSSARTKADYLGTQPRDLEETHTALAVFSSQRQAAKCAFVRTRVAWNGAFATHFHHYTKLKRELIENGVLDSETAAELTVESSALKTLPAMGMAAMTESPRKCPFRERTAMISRKPKHRSVK